MSGNDPLSDSVNNTAMRKNDGKLVHRWIAERLDELKKKRKDLGDALGLSPSRVTEILRGTRTIQLLEAKKLAQFLELPFDAVLATIERVTGRPGDLAFVNQPRTIKNIRVIGAIQAGLFREALEWPPEDQFELQMPIPAAYEGLPVFVLQVAGPSMNEKFPDGSYVLCVSLIDLGQSYLPEPGKFYVVYRRSPMGEIEATIKQLRMDESQQAWLWPMSNHPEFQTPWRLADLSRGNGFEEQDQDLALGALVVAKYEPI